MDKIMLTSPEICDAFVEVGYKKGNLKTAAQLISGIFAGSFIALGGFASAMASHSIDNPGLAKFVTGAVFPVGLMLVLICGGELFTGNCLMAISLLEKKISFLQMLKNWFFVYFGNLLGSMLIAFLIYYSGSLNFNGGKLGAYIIKTAANKGSIGFGAAVASGILCNILVCLAVYAAAAAKDITGKTLMCWFPVMAFVTSGFEHSVANMYYFSIGLMALNNPNYISMAALGDKIKYVSIKYALMNILPVTIGNIIGGVVFVAFGYWLVNKYLNRTKNDSCSISK